MSDKKHIDRLFQEKFKDFDIEPRDDVWENINASLSKKKKKRRPVIVWWQLAGIAAGIVLLLTIGFSMFSSDNTTETPVVNIDSNPETETLKNQNGTENPSTNNQNITAPEDNNIEGVANTDYDSNTRQDSNTVDNNTSADPSNSSLNTNTEAVVNANNTKATQQRFNTNNVVNQKSVTTNKVAKESVASNTTNNLEMATKGQDPDANKNLIKKEMDSKATNTTAVAENSTTTKTTDTEASKAIIDAQVNPTQNTDASVAQLTKDKNTANEDATEAITTTDEQTEALTDKPSIEEAIAEQNNTDEKEKADEPNRWRVSPNVAPVYFSSLGNGSPIDNQFNDNAKASDINFSYGLRGSYALTNKLTIRAGINNINLNQSTGNVLVFDTEGIASRNANNATSSSALKNVDLDNMMLMSANALRTSPEIFNTKDIGTIDQRFGFIEVPLELEYKLLDKKFGINVIGGFSTLFLNANDIYIDVNGDSTRIGEATNLNSTSFSANFGLGVDYNMTNKWNLHLEPMFKYQLNTFTNTSDSFRPYVLGVYTGLSYKF